MIQAFFFNYLFKSLLVVYHATYLFPSGIGLVSQESADIVCDFHPLRVLGDLETMTGCVDVQEGKLRVVHEAIERILVSFEGSDEVLSVDLVL